MNTVSRPIRLAAAVASVAITFALLHSVCAIADHGNAVQLAAAKAAHPVVVAAAR
jgi:hypothetical protein